MPRYKLPEVDEKTSKPLIFGEDPLGDERLDDFQYAMQHRDASYVPGYSEAKQQNELRVKDGKPPIPMPKLQWVRVKRRDGASYVADTDEGMVEWRRLGYKAMGVADLDRYGFGWPPAAGSGPTPDGLICRGGDLALFFVDEERAERNRQARYQTIHETERDSLEKTVEVAPKYKGKIEPIRDERFDEDGKFFLGDSNTPNL